jgi:hypothetical protein
MRGIMLKYLLHALRGEHGVTIKFFSSLLLMVIGIFAFLSNTACGEPSTGCGSNNFDPPVNSSGSQESSVENINNPTHRAYMASSTGLNYMSAATVHRTLGYTGSGVTSMTWTPPPGASNFDFTGAPTPQPGGPPFVFLSPPASFTISYDLPDLPAGVDEQKLSETLKSEAADSSASFASLVITIQSTSTSAAESMPLSTIQKAPAIPQSISVYRVDQWRSISNDVITTTQCQNLYNWLQSDNVFAAMRVPVTVTVPYSSFPLPVIFSPDEDKQPVMKFTINGMPVVGIVDVPLEMRPERMTYLENNLPAATGEHWLALGVAATPDVTCPSGINNTGWEFQFSFPIDLIGKATNLPTYYCYEGNDSPPVGGLAARIMAGANSASIQADGITCIGPQDQSLNPSLSMHIGNPGVAWNIKPPKSVSFMHYLSENTLTPVNLSANSDLSGSTWTFYRGDDSAPDLNNPITNPWTPSSTFDFFWLVGDIPTGASAGSYNVTVAAAKASDPSTSTHIDDLLWVGEWVSPGEENNYKIFLPVLIK